MRSVKIRQEARYMRAIHRNQAGRAALAKDGNATLLHQILQLPGSTIKGVKVVVRSEGGYFLPSVSDVIYNQPCHCRRRAGENRTPGVDSRRVIVSIKVPGGSCDNFTGTIAVQVRHINEGERITGRTGRVAPFQSKSVIRIKSVNFDCSIVEVIRRDQNLHSSITIHIAQLQVAHSGPRVISNHWRRHPT